MTPEPRDIGPDSHAAEPPAGGDTDGGVVIRRSPAEMPLDGLHGRQIAILGYGSQGAAHALNLRDSGLNVIVGNRTGTAGHARATADGFTPRPLAEATAASDLVILALPDEAQGDIYAADIADALRPDATLGFIHGYAIRFGLIDPPPGVGVIMVAPKGPGTAVRARFTEGRGLLCLGAVERDNQRGDAHAMMLAWAHGIGATRAGLIETTFAAEAESDLFGEQAVLCGGMTALILAAFETLVDAGFPPELAYLECCHEVKQVADLVYTRGLDGMRDAISNTAEFGAYRAGPVVVDDAVRARLRDLLEEIRSGAFAAAMQFDWTKGSPWFRAQRAAGAAHPIEPAGERVRSLTPWLSEIDQDSSGAADESADEKDAD